jgi:hypothetical protein
VSDRFDERMRDAKVVHDTRLLGDFAQIYCKGTHPEAARRPLDSRGASLGVYGRKSPVVCDRCAELLAYAESRRAFCPQDRPGQPKPFCSYCETHCYKPEMAERMRDVMRYAGPRSVLHGHAVDGVKHLVDGRRAKKAAETRAEKPRQGEDAG